MSRLVCLAIALSALAAAPGCSTCSNCFGGGCRRPSFMEFRSPCGGRATPAAMPLGAPCGPVCEPCGPTMGPSMGGGPCCDEGIPAGGMGIPAGPMISTEPGTFS